MLLKLVWWEERCWCSQAINYKKSNIWKMRYQLYKIKSERKATVGHYELCINGKHYLGTVLSCNHNLNFNSF